MYTIFLYLQTVQESLRARQQTRDNINETMTVLRRDSKLDSSSVPKTVENKVKTLNEDWARIASQASDLFASRIAREEIVVESVQTQEASSIDGWDSKFFRFVFSVFLLTSQVIPYLNFFRH